jgi:hypothetical protein
MSVPYEGDSTDFAVSGLKGANTATAAVAGSFGAGVSGFSSIGNGVVGTSLTGKAVYGVSDGFDAIVGETLSADHAGVTGRNLRESPGPGACGIYGTGGTWAGKFDGNVQINASGGQTGDLNCSGTVTAGTFNCSGTMTAGTVQAHLDVVLLGKDCAEDFDVVGGTPIEPGTVMVLSDNGALIPSQNAYDKKVAGVISGAGDYRPGLILGRDDSSQDRVPLALIGKVFCKVDARYGAVAVGDLLTTSATPGHARKATDPHLAFGAIIGKALGSLSEGQALLPILVALQ